MSLKNKVAIVTGAKQGIGYGIAEALVKEGCKVVVSDLDQLGCEEAASLLEKTGVETIGIKCDVSKKVEVDNLIQQTIKKFGQLDILVNNAGIYPFIPFAKMTEEDWDKVMDVNLKSVFLTSKSALQVMKDGSKIINISSIASLVAFEGLTHYCGSKGGVNAFVRALAVELAPRKINVNAVAPGAISTPGATGAMNDEARNQMMNTIPWKRWGTPADIANTVVFLAGDKADYITGQTIVVDGGWTLR